MQRALRGCGPCEQPLLRVRLLAALLDAVLMLTCLAWQCPRLEL